MYQLHEVYGGYVTGQKDVVCTLQPLNRRTVSVKWAREAVKFVDYNFCFPLLQEIPEGGFGIFRPGCCPCFLPLTWNCLRPHAHEASVPQQV
jgi:hypothetical protein